MILPFNEFIFTDEELDTLEELFSQMSVFSSTHFNLAKAESDILALHKNGEPFNKLEIDQLAGIQSEKEKAKRNANELIDQFILIQKNASKRYIVDESNTVETIFADIDSTLSKITKNDYIHWQKQRAVELEEYSKLQGALSAKEDSKLKERLKALRKQAKRGFISLSMFLSEKCELQIAALTERGLSIEEAAAPIFDKAGQFYKRPAETKQREHFKPEETFTDETFYDIPSSPAISKITEILDSSGDFDRLAESRNRVDCRNQITIKEKKGRALIEYNAKNSELSIISTIDKIKRSNVTTHKVFNILLEETLNHSDNGIPTQRLFTVPISEFVDNGLYNSGYAATRGIGEACTVLLDMKVLAFTQKMGKDTEQYSPNGGANLFSTLYPENGQVFVGVNMTLNWKKLAPYCKLLPKWTMRLKSNPFILADYIFTLARENSKTISEKGYIDISYKAISAELQLPDASGKHADRDVKNVINNAIADIENAFAESDDKKTDEPELSFLQFDENQDGKRQTIKKWLNNGYLRVTFKGKYLEPYSKIAKKTTEAFEKETKTKKT